MKFNRRNFLVFRETQTQVEWLQNLNAKQVKYNSSGERDYGEVHEGFLGLTEKLEPDLPIQQLSV